MRATIAFAIAIAGFATARFAMVEAKARRPSELLARPYAPTPGSAPIIVLGYREAGADLLFARMLGYFGTYKSEPAGTAALAEAIVALDPKFQKAYELGAVAMSDARHEPDNALMLRATALLEKAAREFPKSWRIPNLAGQIYLADLRTTDPALRRDWDEKGSLLLETAARMPNAPAELAVHAAVLQTRLGKRERAINGLREILLITSDRKARAEIIARLAEIEETDADEIAAELLAERARFERRWKTERSAVSASMYILIGAPLERGFDLVDLATGGRDVIAADSFERLEPLTDPQ